MTTTVAGGRPSPRRRAAAALALSAWAAALLYLAGSAISHWYVLLASVLSLGVVVIAAWYILSRRGAPRGVATGVAAIALIVFAVIVVANEGLIVLAVGFGLAVVSITAAGYALEPAASAGGGWCGRHDRQRMTSPPSRRIPGPAELRLFPFGSSAEPRSSRGSSPPTCMMSRP